MTDLLINETTNSELQNFAANPGHALLLAGAEGSGRLALAKMLATELLVAQKLVKNSSYKLIEPDERNTISIGQIRELKQFSILKSISDRRVVIVAGADNMTLSAQNSFLKLLEEPPEGMIIILTASAGRLRPTVVSRVQQVVVRPVLAEAAINYFTKRGFDEGDVQRANKLAGGRIGLISQLLGDSHPLKLAAELAREVLAADTYRRLARVNELAKDKESTANLLVMLSQMAVAAIDAAKSEPVIERWRRVLGASYKAESALMKNANTKLVLTDLMLNL